MRQQRILTQTKGVRRALQDGRHAKQGKQCPSEQIVYGCSRRRSARVEERDGAVNSAPPAVSAEVALVTLPAGVCPLPKRAELVRESEEYILCFFHILSSFPHLSSRVCCNPFQFLSVPDGIVIPRFALARHVVGVEQKGMEEM